MWKQSDVRCAGQGLYMELSITSVAIITAAKSKPAHCWSAATKEAWAGTQKVGRREPAHR
jgi:hypothetical protein